MQDPFIPLIEQYLYSAFPISKVDSKARFETISASVLGTKQRRFGPQLPPEEQVRVRDVIRDSLKTGKTLQFFSPWGASKQDIGHGFDIAEVSALKQLACLREELGRYGVESQFYFRLEDHTDRFLLGNCSNRIQQIRDYIISFQAFANLVLSNCDKVYLESDTVSYQKFSDTALGFCQAFEEHLRTPSLGTQDTLWRIGWKGTIPETQQQYYRDAYSSLGYPASQHTKLMAKYFSATLARVKLGAVRAPTGPFILIAFTHPIPDNPILTPRVYYRTIPERYTNCHKSPWLAKGYLRIQEDGEVTPRILYNNQTPKLVENQVDWNGVKVECDYEIV